MGLSPPFWSPALFPTWKAGQQTGLSRFLIPGTLPQRQGCLCRLLAAQALFDLRGSFILRSSYPPVFVDSSGFTLLLCFKTFK